MWSLATLVFVLGLLITALGVLIARAVATLEAWRQGGILPDLISTWPQDREAARARLDLLTQEAASRPEIARISDQTTKIGTFLFIVGGLGLAALAVFRRIAEG